MADRLLALMGADMSEEKKPWYQKPWVVLVSFLGGALAILAVVAAKVGLTTLAVKERQAKDKRALQDRLDDQSDIKKEKMKVIDAQAATAKAQAKAAHEARNEAIEKKAHADAAAVSPDALPDALLDSLRGARTKLDR